MNEYLRELNCGYSKSDLPMWKEDGDILITPEGFRWRIERAPTVTDLLHVGDVISTSYGTGGMIISLHKYSTCCCPHRAVSTTLFCYPSWDEPEQTDKYHREVTMWSLVYVHTGAEQMKSGKFSKTDYCYLNELVAVGNRILHLYEANDDEVFIINQRMEIQPMQLELF
jgi:hypothetical protein